MESKSDPDDNPIINQHEDGAWWFWNETWTDELGPYDTYAEAQLALDIYAETL